METVRESSGTSSRSQALVGVHFTQLPPTAASVGQLCNFVSRHPPFDTFEFANMVSTLVFQVEMGAHVIAVKEGHIVAYVGWIPTTREIAEAWVANTGPLNPGRGDAVAATVLATNSRDLILPLIHEAKKLNRDNSVYWKRQFVDGRDAVKRVVRKKEL